LGFCNSKGSVNEKNTEGPRKEKLQEVGVRRMLMLKEVK
jgi:hypothetical protein